MLAGALRAGRGGEPGRRRRPPGSLDPQDGERLVRHVDLGRLAPGLPGAPLARPRALAAGRRGAGAAAALGEERLLGARAGAPRRSRARLLRRAGEERPPLRGGRVRRPRSRRPIPRPRADRVQPHRRDRPAPGHGRAGRAMARLEARRQQPRAAHADPRRAARAGRDVAGRAAARAVPRGRHVGAPATSRHPRCCATAASSTSSTRPGTAAGATAPTRPGVARAQTLLGPWEKRRRPILRGGGGDPVPRPRGRDARPRRRAAPRVPRLRARRSRRTASCSSRRLRFGVDGWPARRRGRNGYEAPPRKRLRTTDRLAVAGRPAAASSRRQATESCSARARWRARRARRGSAPTRRWTVADREARAGPCRDGLGGQRRGDRAARYAGGGVGVGGRDGAGSPAGVRLPPGRPVAEAGRIRLRVAVGRRVRRRSRFRGRLARRWAALSRHRAGRAAPAWR